jgi:hypothetical protein
MVGLLKIGAKLTTEKAKLALMPGHLPGGFRFFQGFSPNDT